MAQDKKTVLIVDDEVDVAALLQLVLESDDLDVVTALDGPSAIKQVRERCPDLVLLDVAMPGHDGFEVYREIRAIPSAGTTRVVFLTGLGEALIRKRIKESGAVGCISKHVDPYTVRQKVRDMLGLG